MFTDSYTSATFADKNVGTGKTVSVSGISISGTDAGNYTFNTTATTTADITAAFADGHRVGHEQGVRRQDDGDGDTGRRPGRRRRVHRQLHECHLREQERRDTQDGDGERHLDLRSGRGQLHVQHDGDNDGHNHRAGPDVTATGVNKVYDGTTAALVILGDDRVSGDVLTVSYSATFADKNVGTGKPVSVSGIVISAARMPATTPSTRRHRRRPTSRRGL